MVNLRLGSVEGATDDSIAEQFGALADLRKQGLIRHLGLSGVSDAQLTEAQAIAPVVTVQNLYNLADRTDDALVDRCAAENIAYAAFFPLGGFTPLQSQTLGDVADRLGASRQQVALAWLLQRSPSMVLIPGTSSVTHLRENVAAAELAAIAEQAGYDGIFCEDYITYWSEPDCPTADPWIALAAMAVATERIRLGTTVTAPARRRPWKLARETLTLDHLSGGRVTMAVGLGDVTDPGFARVSEETDPAVRARRLDESLEILRGLWSGERFSYSGREYTVDDVLFAPGPVQRPSIPLRVGGGWPRQTVLRRALRQDGICAYKFDPADPYRDDEKQAAVSRGVRSARWRWGLREHAAASGDRPALRH